MVKGIETFKTYFIEIIHRRLLKYTVVFSYPSRDRFIPCFIFSFFRRETDTVEVHACFFIRERDYGSSNPAAQHAQRYICDKAGKCRARDYLSE